jgi:deoxyribose-phosphate aldolase
MTDLAVIDAATALGWSDAPDADDLADDLARAEAALASDPVDPEALVGVLDLTTLEGSDTPTRVTELCRRAQRPSTDHPALGPVAAVCVYPTLVPVAMAALADSPVRVASVAGAFPSGLSPLPVRLADISAAVAAGADEIDIVLNRSAFLDGDLGAVHADVAASVEAADGREVKVILEVGELVTPERIHSAALLALAAGADFIKTSTGKIPAAATPEAVACMARAARRFEEETGRPVGIKVAGGVRTTTDAARYAAIVTALLGPDRIGPDRFRIGASSLLDALVADLPVDD